MITSTLTPSIDDLTAQLSTLQINKTYEFVCFPRVDIIKPQIFWPTVERALTHNPRATHISIPGSNIPRKTLRFFLDNKIYCSPKKISEVTRSIKAVDLLDTTAPLSPAHVAALIDNDSPLALNDIESLDSIGRTPLQLCAILDSRRAAQYLVRVGADPRRCTQFHGSAIGLAARHKHLELLQIFSVQIALLPCNVFSSYQSEILSKGMSTIFKVEEVATALFGIVHRRREGSQTLFKQVCRWDPYSQSFLEKYYKVETAWRLLWHTFEIAPSHHLDDKKIVTKTITYQKDGKLMTFHPLSGGFSPFFLNEMKEATDTFLRCFGNEYNNNIRILKRLGYALEFAADQPIKKPLEVFTRWKQHRPTFISVEFDKPAHVLMVFLWRNHFIICNRGSHSRKPVEVFRFNPKSLTPDLIQPLLTRFPNPESYEEYVFNTLHTDLQMSQSFMEKTLETMLNLPKQEIGNCSWKSPETCVYTYFLLSILDAQSVLLDSTFTKQKALQEQFNAVLMFKNWLYDQKLTYLERYLNNLYEKEQCFFSSHEPIQELRAQFHEILRYMLLYPQIKQKALALKRQFTCLE